MNKWFIGIIFFLVAFSGNAQLNLPDTFKTALIRKVPDSVKIDKLNQLIHDYAPNNPEMALLYSDTAVSLSKKNQDSLRLAYSFNRKGVACYYLGDYNSSLENYYLALEIKRKIGETVSTWREYSNIGLVLRILDQNVEALMYFKLSLNYAEESNDKILEANALNNIGICYRGLKKYKEAKQAIIKALNINTEIGANQLKAHNLNNLGNIYYDQKNYSLAIEYFKKALVINKSLNNTYEEIQNLNNLSKTYPLLPNFSEAKACLLRAENLLKQIQSKDLKLTHLLLYGNYYTYSKDYKNANNYKNDYIKLSDSISNANRINQLNLLKKIANTEKEIQKIDFLQKINTVQEEKIRLLTWVQIAGVFVILIILALLLLVIRSLKNRKTLNHTLIERTKEVETLNEELKSTLDELYTQHECLQEALKNLQVTQTQLVQSEKIASLGTLAAGMAHEINNPLNFILGGTVFLDMFIKENFPERYEEVRPSLDGINVGIDRAADIVKNLSQFNASENMPLSACNLNSIIDDCLVIMHSKLINRIEVQKQFADETYIFNGNEGKLHQALMNILSNASQAIEDKGRISIITSIANYFFKIEITDNGEGILPENLKKIFDPFFTTKDPGNGTGLGLSITYNIIQEHKGTIEIESQPGVGTKVIIQLPLHS